MMIQQRYKSVAVVGHDEVKECMKHDIVEASGRFLRQLKVQPDVVQAGLLLPHFVFIFCTKARSTLTARRFSHFATSGSKAAFISARYHASTICRRLSAVAPCGTVRTRVRWDETAPDGRSPSTMRSR